MGARRGTVRWIVALGLLVGACIAGVPQSGSAQTFPGDANAGRRIFVDRGCGRCHSIWGNGGVLGPDLALVGAGRSMDQLAGLFWNHTPRMIETVRLQGFSWPIFTETDLADIISYVYYVKLFDELGDAQLGGQWFIAKRCAECHAVGGQGGRSGPALDTYARFVSPIMLAQGMWNAGAGMRAQQQALGVPIPEFIGREMADIQAYIRQQSSSRDREAVLLQSPNPGTGEGLFTSKGCVRCHGAEGRGTAYGPNVRTVTNRRRVSEIAGVLWNHSLQMASAMQARGIPVPHFEGTELAEVIAFLYYLPFTGSEGDERRGQEVFSVKGCANCHSPDAPAPIGPDLSQSEAIGTTLGLATAMWNHAPAMFDMTQLQQLDWPRFEDNEMPDVLAYLRALKAQR